MCTLTEDWGNEINLQIKIEHALLDYCVNDFDISNGHLTIDFVSFYWYLCEIKMKVKKF